MESLIIEATKSSPLIHFDANMNLLVIKGESYPENAAKTYAPVFAWLEEYLKGAGVEAVEVNMEIPYFNSSSSKVLMNIFEMLEAAAKDGKQIVVNWRYHKENETSLECGEEFKEDLTYVQFNLVEIPEADE